LNTWKRLDLEAVKRVSYEFRRFDVLVTPTMPSVAPKISEVKKMTLEELYPFVKFLEPFNFLGFPALVVPCGFANLPIGVHLVSKPNQEGVLIGLAERYQSVTDWHTRTPAMFGELDV
jgi:Asp-tRNAAsn/Glu-tRNAGln amidotransferase A subunit and related amidases